MRTIHNLYTQILIILRKVTPEEVPTEEVVTEEITTEEDTFTYTTSVTNPDNSVTKKPVRVIVTTRLRLQKNPVEMGA